MLAATLAVPALRPLGVAPADQPDDLLGDISFYVADGKRTLLEIARERQLGVPEISALNPGVDPWVPPQASLVMLPTAHLLPDAPRRGVVINLAELRLYHFPDDGPPRSFPIGVGRDGYATPLGTTTIVRKKAKPVWYPTDSAHRDKPWLPSAVPPGPENPLGEFALYLGWPTYLMHGTNKPFGVGRRVSRGCIRMYPEDIDRLYRELPVGTVVRTIDQPVKLGWHGGELYLEAHPDLAQLDELEATYRMSPRPIPDLRATITVRAGVEAGRIDWRVVAAELGARRGVPIQITRVLPQVLADERVGAPPLAARTRRGWLAGYTGLY